MTPASKLTKASALVKVVQLVKNPVTAPLEKLVSPAFASLQQGLRTNVFPAHPIPVNMVSHVEKRTAKKEPAKAATKPLASMTVTV